MRNMMTEGTANEILKPKTDQMAVFQGLVQAQIHTAIGLEPGLV
jgi:hypothetical protein